jgi:plastocyanin
MGKGLTAIVAVLLLALYSPAAATDFTAVVTDQDGQPVVNAVVSLLADSSSATPAPSSRLPAEKTIDQRNETFIPLVTIIPKGGRISFANNDQTTHQVYSFSRVKQFEMTLNRGQTSSQVFDNTGVAALGCNIHDHMIAYVFVSESPWTALTGDDGHALIQGVPPGSYRAQVWHPKFPPGRPLPNVTIALSGDTIRWEGTIKLLPARMARSHSGNY